MTSGMSDQPQPAVTPEPRSAMDWLMDYSDALAGELGVWWQRRAEQHTEEFLAGEKPGSWQAWRAVRQRESPPVRAVGR